jgi:hypothetical protein
VIFIGKINEFYYQKSKKIRGKSMFKFGKNRKNLKFFNRRKNNFADRLTSYLSIRILGRQLAGKMQAKCRQLAGSWQAVGRQLAGN